VQAPALADLSRLVVAITALINVCGCNRMRPPKHRSIEIKEPIDKAVNRLIIKNKRLFGSRNASR
jgi:hypothetical protein